MTSLQLKSKRRRKWERERSLPGLKRTFYFFSSIEYKRNHIIQGKFLDDQEITKTLHDEFGGYIYMEEERNNNCIMEYKPKIYNKLTCAMHFL